MLVCEHWSSICSVVSAFYVSLTPLGLSGQSFAHVVETLRKVDLPYLENVH